MGSLWKNSRLDVKKIIAHLLGFKEDGIDSSKDSGKLIISVLSAVAEIERLNILV